MRSGEANNKLVVISHGIAGARTSNDYITTRLPAEGFTVAAPTHPDLAGLQSKDPSLDPLVLRPRHLSLTIDHMTDTATEPFEEVIVVGHSFGGYSALRLAGANPTSDGVAQHCDSNPGDEVLCTPAARSRFDRLVGDDANFTDSRVDAALIHGGYWPLTIRRLPSMGSRSWWVRRQREAAGLPSPSMKPTPQSPMPHIFLAELV